ncbi:MAG: cell division protein SepF [Lachnospiraceae bacterium]
MSSVDKLMRFVHIPKNDEDNEYDGFEEYDDLEELDEDEYEMDEPKERMDSPFPFKKNKVKSSAFRRQDASYDEKGGNMEVVCFKPKAVEETYALCDTLKDGRAVILNLEEVEMAVAQRILDFVSGSCYSLEANFQFISKNIFMVTPKTIPITNNYGETVGRSNSFDME